MTIPTVWFTGTVGAGKSSVADAVSGELEQMGMMHALIPLDHLSQLLPFPREDPFGDRLAARNLASIWPHYVEAGARVAVIEGVIETRSLRDLFRAAIPDADLTIVLVTAPRALVERRLEVRDIGIYRDRLVARSRELEPILESAGLEAFRVHNDDRPIEAVGREVLQRLRWPDAI